MTWLVYAAVAFIAYKLVVPAQAAAPNPAPNKKRIDKRMPKERARQLLEVDETADEDAIRKAYQAKVRQYHPDVVANAAPEIKALAEKRTKQLNAAYERLIKS